MIIQEQKMHTSENQSQFTAAFIYGQGLRKINFLPPKLLRRRWFFFMCNNVGRNLLRALYDVHHLFLDLLTHSFGQDIPLSPNGAVPDPTLPHIFMYLYSPQTWTLFRMVFPDVEAEWGSRPMLVFYPSVLHMAKQWEPRCACQAQGAGKVCASGFSSAHRLPGKGGYFIFLMLAKDKMALLKNVVTRKCHNFSLKTTSFPFCKWSYLHWRS